MPIQSGRTCWICRRSAHESNPQESPEDSVPSQLHSSDKRDEVMEGMKPRSARTLMRSKLLGSSNQRIGARQNCACPLQRPAAGRS